MENNLTPPRFTRKEQRKEFLSLSLEGNSRKFARFKLIILMDADSTTPFAGRTGPTFARGWGIRSRKVLQEVDCSERRHPFRSKLVASRTGATASLPSQSHPPSPPQPLPPTRVRPSIGRLAPKRELLERIPANLHVGQVTAGEVLAEANPEQIDCLIE